MSGWALVDGVGAPLEQACIPVTDPALTVGWSVFETLVVHDDGASPRVREHLRRLEGSCHGARIPFPGTEVLLVEVHRAAARNGYPSRIRITLTGGGRRIVAATPIDPARRGHPVRAARGAYRREPFLDGWIKHGSRAPWVIAVARAGVDEVLLVDDQGRFTEGTTAGVIAVIDGVLHTAPHDGRILASTTVAELVERAIELGIPVTREGPPARGPWDALYIASSTRHLAPVIEIDGEGLPGWDPVGRALAAP
ncbi:MAG: branched-subunit amino acid aminotransferase/4-amino-4-deoxychorismate lyase [Myxococcota bacterium]|jgi:branched-subunit amino acid aminotransferase/4-amino-4-deoxychorismate lyase